MVYSELFATMVIQKEDRLLFVPTKGCFLLQAFCKFSPICNQDCIIKYFIDMCTLSDRLPITAGKTGIKLADMKSPKVI